MKDLYIPDILELMNDSVRDYGEKPFIKYVADEEIITKSFKDARDDALVASRHIRSITTDKKHIAIIGKTTYEFIIYYLGILASGNVVVPIAPETSASETADLIKMADVEMVIYDEQFSDRIDEVKSLCPEIMGTINFSGNLENAKEKYSATSEYASLSDIEIVKEDMCAIIYTSGTTGVKKGVMLNTFGMIGNILYTEYWKTFHEGDVTLSVLPMHHTFSFSGDVLYNIRNGVTVCLNGDMRNLVKNLNLFQPVTMRIVPMIAQSLLQRIQALMAKNPELSPKEAAQMIYGKKLIQLGSGAAYLSPKLVEAYEKFDISLRQGYGMTEAGCRVSVLDRGAPIESVGRLLNIVEGRVVDGEIQINTPSVMMGYYKNPEATAEMFTEDGWLRTGDSGYITEEGYLFITGRIKNLIILSGGENVSPEAIENKFNDYQPISEIMVYEENNAIVADVYPNYEYCTLNGIDDVEKEIKNQIAHVNATAKASHIISDVRITKEPLPKTETGKIVRKKAVIG